MSKKYPDTDSEWGKNYFHYFAKYKNEGTTFDNKADIHAFIFQNYFGLYIFHIEVERDLSKRKKKGLSDPPKPRHLDAFGFFPPSIISIINLNKSV